MEYAETLATATTVVQGTPTPKVSGVSTSTDWETATPLHRTLSAASSGRIC